MKYSIRWSVLVGAGAAAGAMASAAACSSGTSDGGSPITCGPGTLLSGTSCVAAADADVGDTGTTDTSDAHSPDATTADVSVDASIDAHGHADAALADVLEEPGEPPPDICPTNTPPGMNVLLDCDPTCCANDPECTGNTSEATRCMQATCPMGPLSIAADTASSYIIRTPGDPGTSAACATDACPNGGYVYGLGVQFDSTSMSAVQVTVGSPWELIVGSQTAYCPDVNATVVTTGCVYTNALAGDTIYIMTKDSHAPPRNITFTVAEHPSCPADGGVDQ